MSSDRPAAVIILAAGGGTRMKSAVPKVLHRIGGRSLIGHVLHAATGLDPVHLAVVVRHERDLVVAHVDDVAIELGVTALIADQDDVKGTGRAVQCGLAGLPDDLTGTVVITYGDVPLQTTETLRALVEAHVEHAGAVTVVTAEPADPFGYGRVLRDESGQVIEIVEEKDCTDEQRAIREINGGIFACDAAVLRAMLDQVDTSNAQGEVYLTDVVGLAHRSGHRVGAVAVDDLWQTEGVNTRRQLAALGQELNRRVLDYWMSEGVEVIDPGATWVDVTVTLAPDVRLLPGVQLHGATVVAEGASIGPDTTLSDVQV
ncbi:MAG: NTP transferase domain-containing protein, partial [Nocardioidaceae bacterium]